MGKRAFEKMQLPVGFSPERYEVMLQEAFVRELLEEELQKTKEKIGQIDALLSSASSRNGDGEVEMDGLQDSGSSSGGSGLERELDAVAEAAAAVEEIQKDSEKIRQSSSGGSENIRQTSNGGSGGWPDDAAGRAANDTRHDARHDDAAKHKFAEDDPYAAPDPEQEQKRCGKRTREY